MKFWAALVFGLMSFHSYAVNQNYIGSTVSTIKEVTSYSEYGDGDVVFKLASPEATCPSGYWLRKTDPGFQANLSMVIAAYQAKTSVMAFGLPDEIWSGSKGKYCRMYAISYR
ncbi:hypothetical protein [Photobacterium sp. 53610]|uniref:hypothetical protein n=1 Tax=Photobacterium sp. 53610 TaxID=3102789 RepID=UPI002EDA0C97